jgi:hypothetical protein
MKEEKFLFTVINFLLSHPIFQSFFFPLIELLYMNSLHIKSYKFSCFTAQLNSIYVSTMSYMQIKITHMCCHGTLKTYMAHGFCDL